MSHYKRLHLPSNLVYVDGDLIVRAHLQFKKHGLSRLLHVKSAILVAFYYAFKANNPQHICSHFFGISAFTRNTSYTLGYTEVTRAYKNLLIFDNTELYKNQEFENRTFDCTYIFLCEFDLVRLPNSIELNPRIEFD